MPREREERLLAIAVAAACVLAVVGALARLPYPGAGLGATNAVSTPGGAPPNHVRRPLGEVDLRITLWPHGPAAASRTWHVTCPGAACTAARAHAHDIISEPTGSCSQTDSGPGEAVIVGRIAGHFVDGWFDKRDGCGARRWHHLRSVLRPPVQPAGVAPGR